MGNEEKFAVPHLGKKRIALFNGYTGQFDRIFIRGQVVDVPVIDSYLGDNWDIFCMLPESLIQRFRAIQDMNMVPVRNPRVKIDILPYEGARDLLSYLDKKPVASLENYSGNSVGIFEISLKKIVDSLESGNYILRALNKGTGSFRQTLSDLSLFSPYREVPDQLPFGFGRLKILPKNYEDFIIISDIDKTFLNTRFEDQEGLLETLLERIENKKPVPGMDMFYRIIKRHGYPLVFISASPTFFHRVLEGVFKRFQIPIDGLYLKKIINPFTSISSKVLYVLFHINEYMNQSINEMVFRSFKYLTTTMQMLVEQTSYKLKVLLSLRKMQPTFGKEILIGDNSESDCLAFTVYQALLSGLIPENTIEDFLYSIKLKDREIINKDTAREIYSLVKENYLIHNKKINPVADVFIHMAMAKPDDKEILRRIEEVFSMSIPELENKGIKIPKFYSNMGELSILSYKRNIIFYNDLVELLRYFKKMNPDEYVRLQKKEKGIKFEEIESIPL